MHAEAVDRTWALEISVRMIVELKFNRTHDRHSCRLPALFYLLAVVSIPSPAPAETLYVSTEGRASWSGRLPSPNAQQSDGPLPSLEAARDAVRALLRGNGVGPITVVIRKGEYHLSEPFILTPDDSGTPGRPVIYSAYAGERPVICGGRRIEGWTQTKRTFQLPEGARDRTVWTTSIPEVREGKWYFRQLFIDGVRAQRARTPNFGYYRADGRIPDGKPLKLKYRGSEIRKEWADHGAELVEIEAWTAFRRPILSVDEETRVATLPGSAGRFGREADARYYVENVPEALDESGEWYLDRETGTLSYMPLSTDNVPKAALIAPVLRKLVRLQGRPEEGKFIRNVTFRGLSFCHTDWELGPEGYSDGQGAVRVGAVFEAEGAEDCAIEGCTFSHLGDYAVWFGRGSKRNRIAANDIFDIGAGGIKIGETVQRPNESEQNAGHEVADNHIHNLGNVNSPAHAVWIGQSSNNIVAHNDIHDLFYTAISAGWTWGYGPNQSKGNRIEYNHIHNLGKAVQSDMGAIYTLGVQPGTVIRNNLIHDIEAFTYGGWGIYPDEGSSEMLIENNVVYRCSHAGFHQHYGRENRVRNNIFALNRDYQLMRTRAEKHVSFFFENNIVYFDQGRLLGTNWRDPGFKMDRNIYWDVRGPDIRFSGVSFGEWKESGQDSDSLIADPMFVDAGRFNFNLKPGSPALKLGFKPIDLSTVGPRVPPGTPPSLSTEPRTRSMTQ